MKKGLILEGGAMRGIFSAGVMDVMMENGIRFDGIVGVSAGAAFGVNYKSGQIGRTIRYNMKFCGDKRYCGIGSLLKTGNLFNKEFCYNEVPLHLDVFDFDAYRNDPTDFYVVCTDIESGKPVYHRYTGDEDNGFDWIRASASLPLVSQIVEIDGQKLLDGGISDSIPVAFLEDLGYTPNIAILTQPDGYRKEKNKSLPWIRLKYKKYPGLIKALEERHILYNAQLDLVREREKAGKLFVIRPEDFLPVKRMERDPQALYHTYEIGRKTAEKHLEKMLEFLQEEPQKT
ncbi:MAG: patatin family protein [Clostridia bacterium]|nr:patatin family protein [Clostridia bacterium]